MRQTCAWIILLVACTRLPAQGYDFRETYFGLEDGLSGLTVHDVSLVGGACYVTGEKAVYAFDGDRFAPAFVFPALELRPRMVFAYQGDLAVVGSDARVYDREGNPAGLIYAGRFDGMPLCRTEEGEYRLIRDGVAYRVALPRGTILAATLERDTLVSDGWQIRRLRDGRPTVVFGTRPDKVDPDSIQLNLWTVRYFDNEVSDLLAFDGRIFAATRDVLLACPPFGELNSSGSFSQAEDLHRRHRRLIDFSGMLLEGGPAGVRVVATRDVPDMQGRWISKRGVNAMAERDGQLFLGTTHSGLYVLSREHLRFLAGEPRQSALGIVPWRDTFRIARPMNHTCHSIQAILAETEPGYGYLDGAGGYAQACGQFTYLWDDAGVYAAYEVPDMRYIAEDSAQNLYLGARHLVLRIPAGSRDARLQVVPDTLARLKGLTLLKWVGDSLFIGDEGEIRLLHGGLETILPFPVIRDVVPLAGGLLMLGYGTESWFLRPDRPASEVRWLHPTISPVFMNAAFADDGNTYFTSDEGLYGVRTPLLLTCLDLERDVPLARLSPGGSATIEFNGGYNGSALRHRGYWYLPAVTGVVQFDPPDLQELNVTWTVGMAGARDTVPRTVSGAAYAWYDPVAELSVEWDFLPQIDQLLMQLYVNGKLEYSGAPVSKLRVLPRRGINRLEVVLYHPGLPGGRAHHHWVINRQVALLSRVDFWIAVTALVLAIGLAAYVYSARKYRRILVAHKGMLKDKAVLMNAWFSNPAISSASRLENIQRSYVHDIEGGLRVSADSLRLLADPKHYSPEMLLDVAAGLESLLDISRRTSAEIHFGTYATEAAPQSIRDVADSVVSHNQSYAHAKGVTVSNLIGLDQPWAAAPELGRVLYVLVNNAIKFSNPGGRVEVDASMKGNLINITVTDEGRGFVPGHPGSGAGPAIRPSPGTAGEIGSGQGIYLAGRLVDEMGGVLSLAPRKPGPGTIASVTLPVN